VRDHVKPAAGRSGRDVMVSGMGFCMPGLDRRVQTAQDLWDFASRGQSALVADGTGIAHASVRLTP
jgi:3-oxoacyl-[acyl-carrier-protein] synthase II